MNSIENIYQELGENICLYPFFGAFYQTNNVVPTAVESMPNSVRPCSIVMADDRHKWDIVDASVHNSRNTPAWKQMRQDFVDNKFHEIYDCRSCSYNEQSGTTSPRQQNNKFLAQFLQTDIVSEVKRMMANNNTIEDIVTLDYYPSNYCNYSCIMCAGGASSQRQTFEVKVLKYDQKIVLNAADPDFFAALEKVQLINFTGGETALQKQVHDIMDYLIEKDLAKNILITLLTNASSSANDLDEKFRKFKQVIYNVSIDGIGQVIEYQRRGAKWSRVEPNALELMNHAYISTVINYVLTGVNVLSAMDFVNWAYDAGFGPHNPEDQQGSFINVSPVFRVDHLGVAALPPELRELALDRLKQGRQRFESSTEIFDTYYTQLVDRFISVIETTLHNPTYLPKFIKHIQLEDSVSKTKLTEVVPEWTPYFQS
jgi:MoaA/NifB/PqqE/SkfB family radical SAM enzyme